MGKKGKKAQAGKHKKLTPKDVGKRLDVLVRKLGEELEGADLFKPLPPRAGRGLSRLLRAASTKCKLRNILRGLLWQSHLLCVLHGK